MSAPLLPIPQEKTKVCVVQNGRRTCKEIVKPIIFGTKQCPWCSAAKGKLQSLGMPFQTIDVGGNPRNFGLMMQVSNQTGTPVVIIGNRTIVGYSEKEIERAVRAQLKPSKKGKKKT